MGTKIRISSNLLLLKILGIIMIFIFLKLILDNRNIDNDFRIVTEYKIYLIVSAIFLAYFLMRPIVYHDEANLYIKKISSKEMVIPLKKIQTIFVNYIGGRGTSNNSIEYIDINGAKVKVRFNSLNTSDKLRNFIDLVKRINPLVEII